MAQLIFKHPLHALYGFPVTFLAVAQVDFVSIDLDELFIFFSSVLYVCSTPFPIFIRKGLWVQALSDKNDAMVLAHFSKASQTAAGSRSIGFSPPPMLMAGRSVL